MTRSMRESTEYIVVHCAATKPDMDIGAAEIDKWHKQRGFIGIGYHAVIRRDGSIELGRHFNEPGAHVKGLNRVSVGVCMVGGVDDNNQPEDNFTPEQFASLKAVLQFLTKVYPGAGIIGHRDMADKACPSFDVHEWLEQNPLNG